MKVERLPMVGKGQKCLRQFFAAHFNGAGEEIEMQNVGDVVVDVVVVLQQIGNGRIEVSLAFLRTHHLVIVVDGVVVADLADEGDVVFVGM